MEPPVENTQPGRPHLGWRLSELACPSGCVAQPPASVATRHVAAGVAWRESKLMGPHRWGYAHEGRVVANCHKQPRPGWWKTPLRVSAAAFPVIPLALAWARQPPMPRVGPALPPLPAPRSPLPAPLWWLLRRATCTSRRAQFERALCGVPECAEEIRRCVHAARSVGGEGMRVVLTVSPVRCWHKSLKARPDARSLSPSLGPEPQPEPPPEP